MMNRWCGTVLTALLLAPSLALAQNSLTNPSRRSLVAAAQEAKVATLISEAERHFRLGEAAYKKENFEAARAEFDRAVDSLLAGRLDIRTHPRLRAYFSSLIDRIHQLETEAIASGKGIREQRYEPALHDELANLQLSQEDVAAAEEDNSPLPKLDFELSIRPEVRQYIHYFTHRKRGRKTMAKGLHRAGKYLPLVREIFRQERIPLDLVWLAQAESNWRPRARSRAGAVGLWQFVPWRGRQFGLRQNRWLDERSSIEQATRASARYLRFLYDRFLDWQLAMAAYNCGENRVDQAIAACGYADFWYLRKHRLLPRETRNYVPITLAIIIIAKQAKKYGFGDIEAAPPMQYDTVTVNSAIDLRLVAEMTNTPYETIEELNPELKRGMTPPGMAYKLRLPANTDQEFIALLDRIPAEHRGSWRVIRVKANESLATIARRNKLRAEQLARVNGLDLTAPIDPGTALVLPLEAPREALRGRVGRGGREMARWSARRLTVTVRPGDTLSGIAARYGTSVRDIARLNHISRRSLLRVGQRLTVYVPVRNAARTASGSLPASYRVRRGDTLYGIARQYRTSVAELRRLNGLRSNKIYPGQRLRLSSKRRSRSNPASRRGNAYVVQPGDTLSGISQRTGVSLANLRRWNRLRSDRIYPGQRLQVGPKRGASRPGAKKISYRVRPGDSLSSIARRHGVTIAKLKTWNRLRSDKIIAGQRLTIYR